MYLVIGETMNRIVINCQSGKSVNFEVIPELKSWRPIIVSCEDQYPDVEILLNNHSRDTLNSLIEVMDPSVRLANCLRSGGITTIGELVERTEDQLEELRYWGPGPLKEVRQKLAKLGLKLKDD